MYRYNYKFLEMLSDCAKMKDDKLNGYIPLKGLIRKEMVEGISSTFPDRFEFDETKLQYFEFLAQECQARNTQLIFVASPYYKGGSFDEESFSPISNLAAKYGLPFYYLNVSDFTDDPCLFKDSHHLNDEGAKAFTAELVHHLTS